MDGTALGTEDGVELGTSEGTSDGDDDGTGEDVGPYELGTSDGDDDGTGKDVGPLMLGTSEVISDCNDDGNGDTQGPVVGSSGSNVGPPGNVFGLMLGFLSLGISLFFVGIVVVGVTCSGKSVGCPLGRFCDCTSGFSVIMVFGASDKKGFNGLSVVFG
jgi:hypothetical protein